MLRLISTLQFLRPVRVNLSTCCNPSPRVPNAPASLKRRVCISILPTFLGVFSRPSGRPSLVSSAFHYRRWQPLLMLFLSDSDKQGRRIGEFGGDRLRVSGTPWAMSSREVVSHCSMREAYGDIHLSAQEPPLVSCLTGLRTEGCKNHLSFPIGEDCRDGRTRNRPQTLLDVFEMPKSAMGTVATFTFRLLDFRDITGNAALYAKLSASHRIFIYTSITEL
jgi:hypothetical protein